MDKFGDNVARAMMDGGGWATRHDAFKWMAACAAGSVGYVSVSGETRAKQLVPAYLGLSRDSNFSLP